MKRKLTYLYDDGTTKVFEPASKDAWELAINDIMRCSLKRLTAIELEVDGVLIATLLDFPYSDEIEDDEPSVLPQSSTV